MQMAQGRKCVEAIDPAKPEMELTKMNAAETPAVVGRLDQPANRMIGEIKIPPPVPVKPDSPPIKAPTENPRGIENGRLIKGLEFSLMIASLIAPKIKMIVRPTLNHSTGKEK